MKRWLCIVCAVTLLLTCAGCMNTKNNLQERVTYTSFPTELTIHKIGTMTQKCTPAAGGLYYRIGERYGVATFDGTVDSGAIYKVCQPLADAFLVAKEVGNESDSKSFNTAGVVDAQGKVIVPLQYASVALVDDRFIRAVEITGTCETKDGSITEYKKANGDTVYCTGNWYLYDITTGKRIPNATGTHPYAAYSYGGQYVKYVSDAKEEYIVHPDGTALPAEAIHLTNGYYVMEQECAVYDAAGTRLFTYDPNGYIPTENKEITDYILGKKTVEGKDVYVLMDLTGAVVTAELEAVPTVCGSVLHTNKKVLNLQGEPLFDALSNTLYMDPFTRQLWMMTDSDTKEKILFDKDGNVLYSTVEEGLSFNVNNFSVSKKDGDTAHHLVLKSGAYDVVGASLAPWLVRVTAEDGTASLVETISGSTLLEGYSAISVGGGGEKALYVYAENAEGTIEIYCVR